MTASQPFTEFEIVDTLSLGGERYARRNVKRRGVDDRVAALQRCRQTFRLRSVERQRGDAELREHLKTRFALVQDQDIVVAGLAKKMSDGVADLACADQCYAALAAGPVLLYHGEALVSQPITSVRRRAPSPRYITLLDLPDNSRCCGPACAREIAARRWFLN